MAIIDLDAQDLKTISRNIESYDDTLINNYFIKMKDYITKLLTNQGIKTDEVREILTTIDEKIDFYSNDIKSNLKGLEETIATSLNKYTINTETVLEKLYTLFYAMEDFNNSGKFDFNKIDSVGSYMTSGN